MRYKDYGRIFIGFLFLFLAVVVVAFLKTKSIEEKNSKNYGFLENIYKIELIYHEMQSVSSNELSYINYDLLNQKFAECDRLISELESSKELASLSSTNYPIMKRVAQLRGDFTVKRDELESFKALNAVAVNSLRYLESDPWIYQNKSRIALFVKIATLGIDKSIDIELLQGEINTLKATNEDDALHKIHALNILKASAKIREISALFGHEDGHTGSLKNTMLTKFEAEQKTDKLIKNALYLASFFGLLTLIFVFVLLSKNKKELYKFHSAIDKSDSFVALTDSEGNITYLNDVFEDTVGGRALDQSIFSIFEEDKVAFEQIQAALLHKKSYRGELKIKKERGEYIHIKIMALGLYEDDKPTSALFMGMDINYEKNLEESLMEINKNLNSLVDEKLLELKQKDAVLLQHSRFAAMAEAISSIAHQWRQPLNALGIIIQDIKMAAEYGELTKEYIDASVANSKEIILQMSKTIDGFRSFLKSSTEREIFDISFAIQKAVLLCDSSFRNSLISLEVEYPKEKVLIDGYMGDLVQSMLSILMNSKENFDQKGVKNAQVKLNTKLSDGFFELRIKDNGGGCSEDVLKSIFEPYFSTKSAQLGTGIGLFLVKTVVEKNMGGKVEAYNEDGGLVICITLPAYTK